MLFTKLSVLVEENLPDRVLFIKSEYCRDNEGAFFRTSDRTFDILANKRIINDNSAMFVFLLN